MDNLTPEKRSWNMSRIRGKNTKPELAIRSVLHRMGYRFRLSDKNLPGHPDIVLPKYKVAVFVHGCFWHRHSGCRYAYTPKSRLEFWNQKFKDNVERDKRAISGIKNKGWLPIIIWECEVKYDLESTIRKFVDQLMLLKGTASKAEHRLVSGAI